MQRRGAAGPPPAGPTALAAAMRRGPPPAAAPPPPNAPPRPPGAPWHRRCAAAAARAARVALRLLAVLAVLAAGAYFAFVSVDAVGLPVTRLLVRIHRPRPEHFQPQRPPPAASTTVATAATPSQASAAAAGSVAGGADDGDDDAPADDAPPRLPTDGALLTAAYRQLTGPLRLAGRRWGVHYEATRPSATKYGPHQWLWDSAFHAMAHARRNVTAAIAELRSLFSMQDGAAIAAAAGAAAPSATTPPAGDRPHRSGDGEHDGDGGVSGMVPEMTYWGDDPNQVPGPPGFLFGYAGDHRRRGSGGGVVAAAAAWLA